MSSTLLPCQSSGDDDTKISTPKYRRNCLLCNIKLGCAPRNSINIFGGKACTTSEHLIVDVINSILEQSISKDNTHSSIICKKCLKLVNEVDEINNRLKVIKYKICSLFQKTINNISKNDVNSEEVIENIKADEKDVENLESISNFKLENVSETKTKRKKVTITEVPKNIKSKEIVAKHETKTSEPTAKLLDTEIQDNDFECSEDIPNADDINDDFHNDDNINDDDDDEEDDEDDDDDEDNGEKGTDTDFPNNGSLIEEVLIETKNINKSRKKIKKDKVDVLAVKFEDGYQCRMCQSEEKRDAKNVIAHLKNEHDRRLYICDVCGDVFTKRTLLSKHFDDHCAQESGDFQCEVCNRIFNNLRLFRIHKRIHYPQIKSWSCDICGKRYSSKNLLDEHINTHTGIRPYICKVCNKDFASKYTHRAHVKTHEVRPRPHKCSQCTKTFLNQQNLTQHIKTHNGIKDYVCSTCGKAFGSAHNLEVHNIVHTGYKPYICRTCGKAFARKAEIRDHERTHTGEKPYQCEFCGATFSQRSNLQSHKRATHYNDKRYKCDDCGKGFKRRRLLDYHIKAAHTGERPYKCVTCAATFVYPEHFKKHMRIHTGEKPFLCEVCGKAFNSRDNRNAHRFIHSDKKPYECLDCGAGFMRKPLLYAHMQSQGHLNDTIVVNQPRLTTEEEMVVPDNRVHLVVQSGGSQSSGNTQLILAELKDNQVIIQEEDREKILSLAGANASRDTMNQIVIDGEMTFEEESSHFVECKQEEENDDTEEMYGYQDSEGNTIILPRGTDVKHLLAQENKELQLVQIRIPNKTDAENEDWENFEEDSS